MVDRVEELGVELGVELGDELLGEEVDGLALGAGELAGAEGVEETSLIRRYPLLGLETKRREATVLDHAISVPFGGVDGVGKLGAESSARSEGDIAALLADFMALAALSPPLAGGPPPGLPDGGC